MIIGITGKMQNGKDTLGKIIKFYHNDYEIVHFADSLKQICKTYLGLTEEQVNTKQGKQRVSMNFGE